MSAQTVEQLARRVGSDLGSRVGIAHFSVQTFWLVMQPSKEFRYEPKTVLSSLGISSCVTPTQPVMTTMPQQSAAQLELPQKALVFIVVGCRDASALTQPAWFIVSATLLKHLDSITLSGQPSGDASASERL